MTQGYRTGYGGEMVEGLKKEFVTVKRGQDSAPWAGFTVAQVFQDIVDKDGKRHKGPATSTVFVQDVRGYQLPCDFSQVSEGSKESFDLELKAFEQEKIGTAKEKKSINQFSVYWNTDGGTNAQRDFHAQ